MTRYEQRENPGNKALVECPCAGCGKPIGTCPVYVVKTSKAACQSAPSFYYYHPACLPKGATMSFSDAVVYRAAHVIYASEFADALEHRGGNFHAGTEITGVVPALTPAEHEPIIRPLLANIDKAIGASLYDVFVAGGIVGEEEQYDALSDLLMGVRGHGVSIDDSYSEQWEKGLAACGAKDNLPYDEMIEYADLANEKLDAAGYPPESEDEEPDPAYEPIIDTAYHWHGGQGSALYAFASTRQVQSESHRANTLDEIDAGLAVLERDDKREPGDLPKLQRLRAAVVAAKIGELFFSV